MCINYEVLEWDHLNKNFKKNLEKKYKEAFKITMNAIKIGLSNFSKLEQIKSDSIILRSKCNNYLLWKFDFKYSVSMKSDND